MLVILFICLLFELTFGKQSQAIKEVARTTKIPLQKTTTSVQTMIESKKIMEKIITGLDKTAFVVDERSAQKIPVKLDLKVTQDAVGDGVPVVVSFRCSVKDYNDILSIILKRQVLHDVNPVPFGFISARSRKSPQLWDGLHDNVILSGEIDFESNSQDYLEVIFRDFKVDDYGSYFCNVNFLDKNGVYMTYTSQTIAVESASRPLQAVDEVVATTASPLEKRTTIVDTTATKNVVTLAVRETKTTIKKSPFLVEKTAARDTQVNVDLKVMNASEDGVSTAFSFKCSFQSTGVKYIILSRKLLSEDYPDRFILIYAHSPESPHFLNEFDTRVEFSEKIDLESNLEAYVEVIFPDFTVNDLGLYICEVFGEDKFERLTVNAAEGKVVEGKSTQLSEMVAAAKTSPSEKATTTKDETTLALEETTAATKKTAFVAGQTVAEQDAPVRVDLKVTNDSEDNDGPMDVSFKCSFEEKNDPIDITFFTLKRQLLSDTYSKPIGYISSLLPESPIVWVGFVGKVTLSGKIDNKSDSQGYLEVVFPDFGVKDFGLYICVVDGFDKDWRAINYTVEARVVEGESLVTEIPENATYVIEQITAAQDTPVKVYLKVTHDPEDDGRTSLSFKCSFKDLDNVYIELSRKVSSEEEYIAGVHTSNPESISIHRKFNDRVKLPGKIVFESDSEAYFEVIIPDFSVSDYGFYICMVYGRNKFGKYTFHTAEASIVEHGGKPAKVVKEVTATTASLPKKTTTVVKIIPPLKKRKGVPNRAISIVEKATAVQETSAVKVDLKVIRYSNGSAAFNCSVKRYDDTHKVIMLKRRVLWSSDYFTKFIAAVSKGFPRSLTVSSEFKDKVTLGKYDFQSNSELYLEFLFWDFKDGDYGLYICEVHGWDKDWRDTIYIAEARVVEHRG